MWFTMTMMEISTNKLFFIEKIAKPAEPVNGQMCIRDRVADQIKNHCVIHAALKPPQRYP